MKKREERLRGACERQTELERERLAEIEREREEERERYKELKKRMAERQ